MHKPSFPFKGNRTLVAPEPLMSTVWKLHSKNKMSDENPWLKLHKRKSRGALNALRASVEPRPQILLNAAICQCYPIMNVFSLSGSLTLLKKGVINVMHMAQIHSKQKMPISQSLSVTIMIYLAAVGEQLCNVSMKTCFGCC